MSDEKIVQQCSPTLANLKTGNLFGAAFESKEELNQCIRRLNRMLNDKGLRVLPLRYDGKRALIYLYRPERLRSDLRNQNASHILEECGYLCTNQNYCICNLIKRLNTYEEFPHEVGLFLGYPPEDVRGFMEEGAWNCKATGYWKVYGDVEAAERTFCRYRKCTDLYCKQWAKGKRLEQLAVAG